MRPQVVREPNDIRKILENPEWTVKAKGDEVPVGLRTGIAGDIYRSFARMTDGDRHGDLRATTEHLIGSLDLDGIAGHVRRALALLNLPTLRDLQYLVPGMSVAGLLNVPVEKRREVVELVRALVVGSRPSATPEEAGQAHVAADQVVQIVRQAPLEASTLDHLASRIALLYQASDACAALVGNALMVLVNRPASDPQEIVMQSMADRVPIRSTTRTKDGALELLDLESAHQAEPDAKWTFGYGAHACPGSEIAVRVATEIIRQIQNEGSMDLATIVQTGWEPLPNAWIPILTTTDGGHS